MKTAVLLVIAIIASCSNNKQNSEYFEKINDDYQQGKARFNEEYVSHFPKEIESDLFLEMNESVSPEFDIIRLTLFNKINEKEIKTLKKKYEKSIGIYSALENCLLVVNRFANSQNNGIITTLNDTEKELINKDCSIDKYPVPNFWNNQFTTEDTECKLPKDFTIFVIDAKAGIFLSEEKLSNGEFMNDKWKHGYSYGICISEEIGRAHV